MEVVPGMDEVKKAKNDIASASAFVNEGIQDELDDACSICLESFSHTDPSTVTNCRHEFHLQCIIEWCARSSNCPMCWQAISLKDPSSQNLLIAVEQERCFRPSPSRNSTVYPAHPTVRDFEIQHLPEGANDPGLTDQIIQQVVTAAAIWRSHGTPRADSSASSSPDGGYTTIHPSPSLVASDNSESSSSSTARPGPSDFQSFADTWRSRLNSMSIQYAAESISQNTRVWTEKLFSRSSSSMADIVSEIRTEINAGITRMMEHLETEIPSDGSSSTSFAG